jgi:hypothetical protein
MTGEDAPLPRIVATVGLHGSASTWVFNVIRELMIAALGDERVITLYADDLDQAPDEALLADRYIVIKSHHRSTDLDHWLARKRARIVLSVRDPRDACLSMSQRFNVPLNLTVRWIANDCNRLMRLAPQGSMLFRYEQRFFEDQTSARRLAETLGLRVAPAEIDAFFAKYRTDAIRSFARVLADLPPERLTTVGSFMMDRATQILSGHIGDTRSGKWRGLPTPLRDELTRVFGPFLDRFGYLDQGSDGGR